MITFATAEYRAQAERLIASARPFFDQLVIYGPDDLGPDFYGKHPRHFGHRRGFGYWVWKSHLILRDLEICGPDDELFYADSSVVFERDPSPLFAVLDDGIGIFHQKREGHKNSRWTRGEMFRLMGLMDEKYWTGDNLASTFSAWKRTEKSLSFVREWQYWCDDFDVIRDSMPGDIPVQANAPDFKAERHDQSICSLLAIKHDIQTLCDPSQFGDGYRCPRCDYPRILKVDRRIVAPWLARPTMSSIIEVSATATCPMRCSYCPQDKLEKAYHGPKELTPEVFGKCLNNLTPGDAIYFAGFTEPCVNPHIVELIESCLSRGHRTQLYTTGRGLNVQQARTLAHSSLDLIYLHLPDAAGNLSHCESTVPILNILATHRNAFCMTMDNVPHASVENIWNAIPRGHSGMHDRAGNLVQLEHRYHKGPIKCGVAPGLDHSVLLPDGRLALCCMTYSLEHIIGNLAEKPYAEILRDGPIRRIFEAQQNGGDIACRKCVCAVAA